MGRHTTVPLRDVAQVYLTLDAIGLSRTRPASRSGLRVERPRLANSVRSHDFPIGRHLTRAASQRLDAPSRCMGRLGDEQARGVSGWCTGARARRDLLRKVVVPDTDVDRDPARICRAEGGCARPELPLRGRSFRCAAPGGVTHLDYGVSAWASSSRRLRLSARPIASCASPAAVRQKSSTIWALIL